MKKGLLKIFSVMICLFVMAETTGVVLFIHTCHSSNTRDVSAYIRDSSCCCAESTGETAGIPELGDRCCSSEQVYLKAEFTGFPVLVRPVDFNLLPVLLVFTSENIQKIRPALASFVPWQDDSPPIRGKDFIYSIHQIRIPAPVC